MGVVVVDLPTGLGFVGSTDLVPNIMSASACLLQPPSPSSVFDTDGAEGNAAVEIKDTSKNGTEFDNTAIIFDWDDTLLPSSWLTIHGFRLDTPASDIPQNVVDSLAVHASSVVALLGKALELGEVVIITNAETGWVELSASRFIPAVCPMLDKIQVVSARSTYEPQFPNDALEWKIQAFQQQIDSKFTVDYDSMQKTVISFGDSVSERDAVHRVAAGMPNTFTKSIKFVERPDLEQLHREVELVRGCMDYICSCEQDLDLMLTIQLLYR